MKTLGALCLFFLSYSASADEALSIRALRHEESSPAWTISVDYPLFPGQVALNERIQGLVDSSIADFKRESAANLRAREATASAAEKAAPSPRHQLLIRWRTSMPGPVELSLLIEAYSWTGGANGRTTLYGINYDLRGKRFLALADIFTNRPEGWLALVAARCKAELASRFPPPPGSPPIFEAGSDPDPANYDCFTFDENAVTIHFQKYQVAPGSAGTPEVALPRDLAAPRP